MERQDFINSFSKKIKTLYTMDREQTIKCLRQVIEILRPLNIKLDAPAQTPIETAYFHICALYTYLNVDAITISR
jgi:hypothetical protein